jgi:hypothetical protein
MLVIFGVWQGWKAGIIAGCSTLGVCFIIATLMLFFIKRFSLVDVFIPLIFSVIWSVILLPFSFGESAFTAPSAIGSGFILTLCLWRVYHSEGQGKKWLIIPILVYMYEMLPVNIPGPFDDYFAFSGDIVSAALFYFSPSLRNQLPSR